MRTTNKKENVESLNVGYSAFVLSAPIAPAGSVTIYLYPPAGRIEKVSQVGIYAVPPVGGTAGTHAVVLGDGTAVGFLIGQGTFGQLLYFDFGEWNAPLSYQSPPNSIAQLIMLNSIRISNALPLKITYLNNTDVAQVTTPLVDIRTEVVNEW